MSQKNVELNWTQKQHLEVAMGLHSLKPKTKTQIPAGWLEGGGSASVGNLPLSLSRLNTFIMGTYI